MIFRPIFVLFCAACALAGSPATSARAQDPAQTLPAPAQPQAGSGSSLTAAQLFDFAEQARARGDLDTAEKALRALTQDTTMEIRNEARFRLAKLLADDKGDFAGAAVLLRQILDEQPNMAPVRLELARMQAQMGNMREAGRELRAAQAIGLPPQVERLVRFYASALNARKPFGFNVELALAPDTNINRATRSQTLDTVIGEFDLSEDARAQSGLGVATRASGFYRLGVEPGIDLMLRANGYGRFYRDGGFNDTIVSLQAGPQYLLGSDRLNISGSAAWRWFGGEPYSFSYGVNGDFAHPVSKTAQLRLDGGLIHTHDRLNALRSADRLTLGAGIDKALSGRSGGGVRVSAAREFAADPGYSTASGGLDGYLYREIGQTTLVGRLGYDHLEADERLLLYPRRRIDDRFSTSLSGTFRALRVGNVAPQITVSYEKSLSTIELYDYARLSAEIGIVAAF